MLVGTFSALLLIYLSPTVQVGILGATSAPFPLTNPGIVTIPLSFIVGIGVSLATAEPDAVTKFEQLEHQLHLGAPTTRG
jgi:cation/acetate symporter